MSQSLVQKATALFPFLDDRSAMEPYLFEVLSEIHLFQKNHLAGKNSKLADRQVIRSSRNIKMPLTPARDKNIDYILELLLQRFHDQVGRIVSFDFDFDEKTKKLSLAEIEEFTVAITNDAFERILRDREARSLQNLNNLLAKFRIFNLTKLARQARFRPEFSRVLQKGLNKSFFTYNNFTYEKNQVEAAEEYCFHVSNYEHIKRAMDISKVRKITESHADMVRSRLKNYGILSIEVSDYRDNKLDYILHILINDIGSSIAAQELCEVKNFHSLRECIQKVDKILDPARIYHQDIIKFIREVKYAPASDITSNLINVNDEILNAWAKPDALLKDSIYRLQDELGTDVFFDGRALPKHFEESFLFMKNDPVKFNALTGNQKLIIESKLAIMYSAALSLLGDKNSEQYTKASLEDIAHFKRLLDEYADFIRQRSLRTELSSAARVRDENKSIISMLFSFIASLFSRKPKSASASAADSEQVIMPGSQPMSSEAKQIYTKTKAARGPILAMSDFIDLTRENDHIIGKIIKDMQDNNLKIVMPVYNARTALYPKRSSKILIPDIEYLLMPPHVIAAPELITEYIDSLVGFKMHDDVIPGSTLIAIEKYLRTIQRQKRAIMMRKQN